MKRSSDGASDPSAKKPRAESTPGARSGAGARVRFYGAAGAFSEDAAREFFKSRGGAGPVEFVANPGNIDGLFSATVADDADCYAVVPFENSVSGTLQNILIKLVTTPGLHIVGEVVLAEEHCLCAQTGATKEGIRTVMSHPHLLTQSNKFLKSLEDGLKGGGASLERACTFDSAAACALVDGPSKAAIASRRAAEAHGLVVLDSNFADVESETRYLVLGSRPAQSANRLGRRCTVSFVLANQQGAMFKCLSCFAFRNLNVLKISTVPLGGKQDSLVGHGDGFELGRWDYVFVLDFIASPNQAVNDAALLNLREYAARVRVLGEYAPATSYVSPSKRDISQLLAFA